VTGEIAHPSPTAAVDLGRLKPGEIVTIHGSATTSFDGAVFDATTTTTDTGTRPGGLYQTDGVGLRVVEQHIDTHDVKLVATGEAAPTCSAAGLASPCLVPRIKELAHERLLTEGELAKTLTGSVEVAIPTPPPPPLVSSSTSHAFGGALAASLLVAAAIVGWRWRSEKKKTPLGQVQAAAQEARARTASDPTLAPIRVEIDDLVLRAKKLDAARVACARRLSGIDRGAIARKRAAWEASNSPGAREASQWMVAEEAEGEKLARDHASAVAGLEQIATALRVVALQAREERGVRVAETTRAALDNVAAELTLREDALAEVEGPAEVEARSRAR
jgi:hypothetical protein